MRYFEAGETASYFGSPVARSSRRPATTMPEREARMIASTGKILAAIGIANAARDRTDTLYLDTRGARAAALETCAKGGGEATRAGARSSPSPARSTRRSSGAPRSSARRACGRLIDRFGFNMPPATRRRGRRRHRRRRCAA